MKNLYAKLLAVQQEVGAITKDSNNPFFKSKYFDINGLLDELKPVLNKHGLVVIQPLENIQGKAALTTQVIEVESGQSITSIVPLPETSDAQKMGSAITYLRRYSLQSLFLLQAQDDDGNGASGKYDSIVQKARTGTPIAVEEYEEAAMAGMGQEINEAKKEFKRSPEYKKNIKFRTPEKQADHDAQFEPIIKQDE